MYTSTVWGHWGKKHSTKEANIKEIWSGCVKTYNIYLKCIMQSRNKVSMFCFVFFSMNLKVYQLPWFSMAAITKISPTRTPRRYEAYFLSSGGLKSKIKVPAGFIFPKASLLGLQMASLLLFLHMVNPLHKNTLGITSSYKYITFMASFKDCFLNGESLYWICSIQLLFCMSFFFFSPATRYVGC